MRLLIKIFKLSGVDHFLSTSVLISWSNLRKCTLILVLGSIAHILWIFWFLYASLSPSLQQWMNLEDYNYNIKFLLISFLAYLILILPCIYLRDNYYIKTYYPYLVVVFFSTTFMYEGHAIGILSPVTIASFISLMSVGLVLFERKYIYPIFIPFIVYVFINILLSSEDKTKYAPVFSQQLNESVLIHNQFWVYSQMYLYAPVFLATIVLFEILLTQWRNREKQINKMSQIDPLTGIFNRRKIGSELMQFELAQQNYALVLLDLDYFKSINDNYGHDMGDIVLINVAKILSNVLREDDILGRFGGEEFIILFKNKSLKQCLDIVERCRKEIERENFIVDKKKTIRVTASFGVAVSNIGLTKEMVIQHADQAMYLAKKSGRNQVRHYFELQREADNM